MKRLLAALLLVTASCAGADVRVIAPSELPQDIYDPVGIAEEIEVELFFMDGDRLAGFARQVRILSGFLVEEMTLRALLGGPEAVEEEEVAETEIPPGTELQSLRIQNGVAIVDLPSEFYRAFSLEEGARRLAQVVWTLTEFPRVELVQFLEGGREFAVIDEEGQLVADARGRGLPVGRDHFSRFAPAPAPSEDADASLEVDV